jgi:hypothetical protein
MINILFCHKVSAQKMMGHKDKEQWNGLPLASSGVTSAGEEVEDRPLKTGISESIPTINR